MSALYTCRRSQDQTTEAAKKAGIGNMCFRAKCIRFTSEGMHTVYGLNLKTDSFKVMDVMTASTAKLVFSIFCRQFHSKRIKSLIITILSSTYRDVCNAMHHSEPFEE